MKALLDRSAGKNGFNQAIHYAAKAGHVSVIQLLHDHGADFKAQLLYEDNLTCSPLAIASDGGHHEAVFFVTQTWC